ncbi:type II toxin-antitoxin system VapC family toxin [Oleomonas cavernae]|uniref:Type II toxin-antitoxin system VapC family toxin n=1 Tax=Oleomonas cavernae TaxID=2320859 RepID=A0A418WDX7_9PROT|nr:type II toxin-antitoxin system VapC family toxin [Oleomonas cavernae]RJF88227.1 type II toxin-antitoxin system VapC family toxin [Oleomonas cavernae]
MILLDTHVLIWWTQGIDQLGPKSRLALDAALDNEQLAVSAVTFWEAALLDTKNRLKLLPTVLAWRQAALGLGLEELPLTGTIAIASAQLENMHGDPADRFLVATALAHDAVLMTADERILAWPGALRRLDARQ